MYDFSQFRLKLNT